MAHLLPSPKMQFFDVNGDPLSGGKVNTYEAGTSTRKATYTTAAASVANANPVILDSRGEAAIFWSTGSYKIVLTDSDDVEVYTVDNITLSASGTAGASFRAGSGVPSDSLGSDGDRYLRTDTGQIYLKGSGTYSVETTMALPATAVTNTPSGNLAAVTVQNALNELQSDVDTRISALTGDVTASGGGSQASTIADEAVTNAKLAHAAAWTVKMRNAGTTGDPSDAALADITEEATPASGDMLVGFLSTGEIRKFDVANISVATIADGSVTTAKLANDVFHGLSAVSAALNDYVAIADTSDSNNKKKALVSSIVNESVTLIDSSDSPYAVVATDRLIVVETDAAVEIDLPPATGSGRRLKIKRDRSDNLLTIDPDGSETIDGEANFISWLPYDVTELVDAAPGEWIAANKSIQAIHPVAWVNSSPQTVTNALTGTYSRTGTTVTVTATAHGHKVGHKVRFDSTSGSATDGLFTVTSVIDANNFTFEHGSSGTTSGNCKLPRLEIYESKNVQSVVPSINTQNAENHVNLSINLPDTNYIVKTSSRNAGVSGNDNGTTSVRFCSEVEVSTHRGVNTFKTHGATTSSASSDHQIVAMVFR